MISVLTTEEFATWFRALDDCTAEDVATGIALVEALGPERAPPESSSLLLWYQCRSGLQEVDLHGAADMAVFAQRVRRIVDHLSSAASVERLAAVSTHRAAQFRTAVERIAVRAHRWRHGHQHVSLVRSVHQDYLSALEALELVEPAADASLPMLRELHVESVEPRIRVLYGVDPPRQRALVILGERLNRRAYGASVRRALAVWSRFLADETDTGAYAAGDCA